MNEKSISEDVLVGIIEVLHKFEPSLLPLVENVQGAVEYPSWNIGGSIFSRLRGQIPYEDGLKVLNALHRVLEVKGHDARFNERTILLLVSAWQRFIEPRRLNSTQ
jgi:hypothetical protein